MPLIKSGSREAVSTNIREMLASGHPRKQAIAAALSTARRYGKKYGGKVRGYAEAGAVEGESAPVQPENEKFIGDVLQGLYGQEEATGKIVAGVLGGMADLAMTPGKLRRAAGEVKQPQAGEMWSDEDEARRQMNMQAIAQRETEAAPATALTLIGSEVPFAKPGQIGVAGGKATIPTTATEIAQTMAETLMQTHGGDSVGIAESLWHIANDNGTKTADTILHELPESVRGSVDTALWFISEEKGANPWMLAQKTTETPRETLVTQKPLLKDIDPTYAATDIVPLIKNTHILDTVHAKEISHVLGKKSSTEIAQAMLDAQLNTKQWKNVTSYLSPAVQKQIDEAAFDTLQETGGWHSDKWYDLSFDVKQPILQSAFERQLNEYAKKTGDKSYAEREVDRLAQGYTTKVYRGVNYQQKFPSQDIHGFRSSDVFTTPDPAIANTYANLLSRVNDPTIAAGAAIEPYWLDPSDYHHYDARGATWMEANGDAISETEQLGAPGVVIHNVHDVYGEPYKAPTPGTVYLTLERGKHTLRSIAAKFDPDKWKKLVADKLGTIGWGVIGAGGAIMAKPTDEQKMKHGGPVKMALGGLGDFNPRQYRFNIGEPYGGGEPGVGPVKIGHTPAFRAPPPPRAINPSIRPPIPAKASTPSVKPMGMGRPLGGSQVRPVAPKSINPTSHVGMIHSSIPGRTDKIPMNVRGGSYILPADVVSGMGQGNSMAGSSALNRLFKMGPYGAADKPIATPKVNYGRMSPMPRMMSPSRGTMGFSAGGTEEKASQVPIIAAGGEFAIPPEVVSRLGGGNMKHGHEILDKLVLHIRQKTIHEMKHLKPPKKR